MKIKIPFLYRLAMLLGIADVDIVERPKIVTLKKNVGRGDTVAKADLGSNEPQGNEDGIWYDEMTPEQKKQYGIFKYGGK